MQAKVLGFLLTFVVTLVTTAVVTVAWNAVARHSATAEWGTSVRLALILSIVLTIVRSLEAKPKQ